MIREFEDTVILWWMDGSSKINYEYNYSNGGFDTVLNARWFPQIKFNRTYYANYSGFLLMNKKTIEEDLLKNYCMKNGFTYEIKYWSKYVSVYIDVPSYEVFWNSDLMKRIHGIYQWLGNYLELAQKFAVMPLMPVIQKHVKEKRCNNPVICTWGIRYDDTSDSEGYTSYGGPSFTFKEYGYRNLQSEDEMIAFMLAYCSRVHWNVYPKDLNLYGIRWHYYRENDLSSAIYNLPQYYSYDPLTYQPREEKPNLKDFF